jgi:hypothetical protein
VPNLIVSAVSTFDNKGLKKGKKEVSAFEKQIKSFGKVFAGVFSATALLNYSKKAVSAFMADEKAAKSLELQLRNTGFAFAAPSVEYYIANLQKTTGVLDDQLRPAFQQLLTVTGSVTQSQDALSTALNISAATGKSLTEVSAALTRGFSGNTTGLSRLGAGISKATLKTGNMEKIMAELNQKFAGQSAARLETYAGQMDLLKVGAANASEEIGKGLLDALSLLSKDKSIEDAASAMESFGKSIGDAIYGLALLISKLDGLAKKTKTAGLADLLTRLQPGGKGASILAGALSVYGSKDRNKPASNFTYDLGPSATKDIERANKLLKEKNKLEADAIAKLKAKSEVDKLKDKFDVERIGLTLALNQATDEETKLRLRAQLAILDNNEALAKKYNAELGAVAAANALATSATTAAGALNFLASGMPALFNSLGELTGRGRNQIAPDEFARLPQGVTNMGAQTAATAAATAQTTATLTLDPNASGDKLINAIGELVLVNLKYGNKLVPAGSLQ